MSVLVLAATPDGVTRVDPTGSRIGAVHGLEGQRPTGIAADLHVPGRAWCCTRDGGVFRSDDRGESWLACGLAGEPMMSIAVSPAQADLVWVGCEPSAVWRSEDAGATWHPTTDLGTLGSSGDWAFPPRPDTHHVRWIACHPADAGHLWVAIEAGALRSSPSCGRGRGGVPGVRAGYLADPAENATGSRPMNME